MIVAQADMLISVSNDPKVPLHQSSQKQDCLWLVCHFTSGVSWCMFHPVIIGAVSQCNYTHTLDDCENGISFES